MGGEARKVALRAEAGGRWSQDLEAVFDACDGRTRAVFVNSPGNPTGWVMPAGQQAALLAGCRERGLYVVADEVYLRLAYETPDGLDRAPSFLDIPGQTGDTSWRETGGQYVESMGGAVSLKTKKTHTQK